MTETAKQSNNWVPEAEVGADSWGEGSSEREQVGRVWLPSDKRCPVGTFSFLLEKNNVSEELEIGSPVTADTSEGPVTGLVSDMWIAGQHPSDPAYANLLDLDTPTIVQKNPTLGAEVEVLSSERERPVGSGAVRACTSGELLTATGGDTMEQPIPAGAVSLPGGDFAPVFFDGETLLGPEAAHLMVAGLSGQAAKTSYVGVMISSVLQKVPGAAALLFNVKGSDLLFLDEPPDESKKLDSVDQRIYETLGLVPQPFRDVEVFSVGNNQVRADSSRLCWSFKDALPYLEYYFPDWYDNSNENVRMLLDGYRRQMDRHPRLSSFDQFATQMRAFLKAKENNSPIQPGEDIWWMDTSQQHAATAAKALRRLNNLPNRSGGLFTSSGTSAEADFNPTSLRPGQVVVIHIDGLDQSTQALVVGRLCRQVLRAAKSKQLDPTNLVVFVDELNMFAESGSTEQKGVRRILREVSSQGRYAGISLFGAGQQLTKVDPRVRDNAATTVMGRVAAAELDPNVYGLLPAGVKHTLLGLGRGEMMADHPTFRTKLKIRFPRPAWRTGNTAPLRSVQDKAGVESKENFRVLTKGVSESRVEEIGNMGLSEDATFEKLKSEREVTPVQELHPSEIDPDNPFAIQGL